MRLPTLVLSIVPLLASTLVFGCDKATPDSQPPTQPATESVAAQDPWGDGTLRGAVELKWGAPLPEGSTIQLRVWKGGEVVHEHDMPATGTGPWDYQFKVDTSDFETDQMFGVAATVVVPPQGEAWYMGDPQTVQIWKSGEERESFDLAISPRDPRAAGDGPPKQ